MDTRSTSTSRSLSRRRKQAVLIGAGHAHLHVAAQARRFADAGMGLVLIDPGTFWYSGLATGMLGGMYEPAQDQVDPRTLIEHYGGTFVQDRLASLDRTNRTLRLASGQAMDYDVLSLNVGSEVPLELVPGAAEHAWSVKPISNLAKLRNDLEQHFTEAGDAPLRLIVIGGGTTGCELAANLRALAERHRAAAAVTLISRGPYLLGDEPSPAGFELAQALARRNIELVFSCSIERIEREMALADDGRGFAYDVAVMATGLQPPRLIHELGLCDEPRGGLHVDARLRHMGDERIFGAGDCIRFDDRALPRLGVYSVREAPILAHNLLATLTGEPLKSYHPQSKALAILNLGRGEGLAVRNGFYWRSRASLWLKDRIDRRFLEQYRFGASK